MIAQYAGDAGELRSGVYWPVKPFVEAAGMDWSAQYRRIVADSRLAPSVVNLAIETPAGPRPMLCLPWAAWHYLQAAQCPQRRAAR